MGKVFFGEMTSRELKERLRHDTTVILPIGATEVCGQHCPVGTDHLTAKEISYRLGKETETIVSPVIPIGDSSTLMGFPGTLTVGAETLFLYLKDVCFSLVANGFERIFFLNTHAKNVYPIDRVARELKSNGILPAQVDFWRFIFTFAKESNIVESSDFPFGHGGEVNTSVAVALFPALVDMTSASKEIPKPSLSDKYEGKIITYRDFVDYSTTGAIGDPTLGSEKKGTAFIERALTFLVQFVKEFKSEPLPPRVDPLTKKRL